MTVVTLEDAQARLSELIDRLEPGQQIVITRDAKPVARLAAVASSTPQPRFGSCRGMLTILKEDDEHLKDFAEYM